jgi:hypothetical protein
MFSQALEQFFQDLQKVEESGFHLFLGNGYEMLFETPYGSYKDLADPITAVCYLKTGRVYDYLDCDQTHAAGQALGLTDDEITLVGIAESMGKYNPATLFGKVKYRLAQALGVEGLYDCL